MFFFPSLPRREPLKPRSGECFRTQCRIRPSRVRSRLINRRTLRLQNRQENPPPLPAGVPMGLLRSPSAGRFSDPVRFRQSPSGFFLNPRCRFLWKSQAAQPPIFVRRETAVPVREELQLPWSSGFPRTHAEGCSAGRNSDADPDLASKGFPQGSHIFPGPCPDLSSGFSSGRSGDSAGGIPIHYRASVPDAALSKIRCFPSPFSPVPAFSGRPACRRIPDPADLRKISLKIFWSENSEEFFRLWIISELFMKFP